MIIYIYIHTYAEALPAHPRLGGAYLHGRSRSEGAGRVLQQLLKNIYIYIYIHIYML